MKNIINLLNKYNENKSKFISLVWEDWLDKNEYGHYYLSKSKKISGDFITDIKEVKIPEEEIKKKKESLKSLPSELKERVSKSIPTTKKIKTTERITFIINPSNEPNILFEFESEEEGNYFFSANIDFKIESNDTIYSLIGDWSFIIVDNGCSEIIEENLSNYKFIIRSL